MNKQSVRWWPAITIMALAGLALIGLWAWPELPRQQRILCSGGTLLAGGALGFLWLLFFSRFQWRTRLVIAGLCVVSVALFAASFRFRGVNGDLLPILEPRWKARPTFAVEDLKQRGGATPTASAIPKGEFPQFNGPGRNAVLDGPVLETNWTSHPPKVLWRQSVGAGWSGFAVRDGLAITMEQRGEEEFVVAYELLTGRRVWMHSDVARYATTIAGVGPRATPTIVGEKAYTFGGTGILKCLDLRSGRVHWTTDTAKEGGAKVPDWGFASSPLLINEMVIVCVGGEKGALHAYSAEHGKLIWAEGRGGADYSSPIEATLLGVRQILNFNGAGVSGHDLDGSILWNYKWPVGHPHVTAPVVVSANSILISSGYGTGSELVKLEKARIGTKTQWTAAREWKSIALKSKFAPIFVKDNYIYGLDDGILTCVELKTGQRKWKDGRYGHGQGLLVAEMILLTSEKGGIVLIEPNPEKLLEIARFQVFSDKTWNPPALAGEFLLMRNDKEAACLQLQTKKELARNVALSFAKPLSHR
ncbi:MAG: outer membrane protein assembly factor BamB family protein [Limisphaerales bacterium]